MREFRALRVPSTAGAETRFAGNAGKDAPPRRLTCSVANAGDREDPGTLPPLAAFTNAIGLLMKSL
jgi:hypothetical protein